MVVSEGQISNIMGDMQGNTGIRLNNHKHKLRHRCVAGGPLAPTRGVLMLRSFVVCGPDETRAAWRVGTIDDTLLCSVPADS